MNWEGWGAYDYVPAVIVLVWFPVDDFDSSRDELVTGKSQGTGYWGMGADAARIHKRSSANLSWKLTHRPT